MVPAQIKGPKKSRAPQKVKILAPQFNQPPPFRILPPPFRILNGGGRINGGGRFPNHTTMQGHLKINIDLFSALCTPQLHKKYKVKSHQQNKVPFS